MSLDSVRIPVIRGSVVRTHHERTLLPPPSCSKVDVFLMAFHITIYSQMLY